MNLIIQMPFMVCLLLILVSVSVHATSWSDYQLAMKKEQADFLYDKRETDPGSALFSYYLYDQVARESGDSKSALSASRALDSWSYLTDLKKIDWKFYRKTTDTRLALSGAVYTRGNKESLDHLTKLTFLRDVVDKLYVARSSIGHMTVDYVFPFIINKISLEAYSETDPTSLLIGAMFMFEVQYPHYKNDLLKRYLEAVTGDNAVDWGREAPEKSAPRQFHLWLDLLLLEKFPGSEICLLADEMIDYRSEELLWISNDDAEMKLELENDLRNSAPTFFAENMKAINMFVENSKVLEERCYRLSWRRIE